MRSFILFIAAFFVLQSSILKAQATYTFSYTGAAQYYTVPANISLITVTISGAQGGGGYGGAIYTQTFNVSSGQVLGVFVGGSGSTGALAAGGYNGGGQAGGSYGNEGSGGGASDIRTSPYGLSNRLIVSGGGGGNGGYAGGSGGSGGLLGGAGGAGQGGGGTGGTASSGGSGGTGNGCGNGTAGSLGIGGAGGNCGGYIGGGGGGGGYYGGGGGGGDNNYCCADGGGGGGGSSYSSVSGGVCNPGSWFGNGQIIIREITGFSITQLSPVICNGQLTAALSATVSGGVAPYTFSWSTGATTGSIGGLGAGTYTCWAVSASAVTYSGTAVVSQPPVFSSFINSQSNVTCNGGNNGYLNAYGSGGTVPYSYLWSPSGGNTSSAYGLTAGTYSCFVTDANGCVAVSTATITQPVAPSIVAFATSSAICIGQSVTLVGGGAQTYTWTNGAIDNVPFSPTVSATYVVTGFNSLGCPGYAQTSVIVNPVPTVSAVGGTLVCPGTAVTLSASGANSYAWNTGALSASAVVNPTVSTIYTVTGSNTLACQNTATVSVNVYTSSPVWGSVSHSAVCSGGSVTMTGNGALSYTWSGGVSNGIPYVPVASNVYTVSGSDVNGCIKSATYAVLVNPLPTLVITGNTAICQGNAAILSASGAGSYTWITGVQTSSVSLSPLTTSVISVNGSDLNGCVNSTSINLVVTPLPVLTINSGGNLLCFGKSMTLLAGGAISYTWMPQVINSVSVSISPTVTSSYTLIGNTNGCTSSVPLTVSVIPVPTLSLSGPTVPVCAFTSVTLTANGASAYLWSNGVGTISTIVAPTVTTVYSVTGTGTNGCTKVDTISVHVKPRPILTVINADTLLCSEETTTLTVSGASSYNWSTADTSASIVVSPSVSTNYSITGIGNNGCSNTINYLLVVTSCSGILELSTSEQSILVYPNPSSGAVRVSSLVDFNLILVNSLGEFIEELNLNESNSHTTNLSQLSHGIYFIIGESQGRTITQKIIITN